MCARESAQENHCRRLLPRGGTSFGFTNGANFDGIYRPDITSYDYAAPLGEYGNLTPAYYEVRRAIEKQVGELPPLTVKDPETAAYGRLKLSESASLFDFVRPVMRFSAKIQMR